MIEFFKSSLFLLILGNAISLIGTLFYAVGRFKKDKSNLLTYTLLSKIFTVITYIILGTISGAYAFLVHIPLYIFAKIKEKKHKKWHALFVIFELCYIAIAVFSFPTDGFKAILICLASTITMIGVWYLHPQYMRLLSLPNSVLYVTFYISAANYVGAITEVLLVFMSNLLSYLKYRKEDKKCLEKN